ncbi:acyl-CoA synthetase, putative [Plasmodium vinckei vinckei]|uniref:Acyl-CoA synthetase, putative n=1 Tax=Plasmodium vinckei vinckei TaxID=54757 RepID=A0A449C0V0_PLAVN|nr:acyl-CoA synthetase, putative [Plasmodium vinckei vinckei]KEG03894.1 long-chain acyl-CoA synthetase [Plasmodium vinckei vinckei]VEV59310.1 acyl-CoA synthetase, putative [Plasmodium vinckei vinckei]
MDPESIKKTLIEFLENENIIDINYNDNGEFKYFEEIKGTAKKNSSNLYRACNYEAYNYFKKKSNDILGTDVNTRYEIFTMCAKYYANHEFLGERKKEIKDGETILGDYVFKTYGEVKNEIEIFASALYQFENIEPTTFTDNGKYDTLKIMGIWSKNRPEWYITDIACAAINFVTVPIYDTIGINSVKSIIQKTEMKVCCVEAEKLESLISLKPELPDLNILIIYNDSNLKDDIKKKAIKAGYKIYFYKKLIDQYKNKNIIPQNAHLFCNSEGDKTGNTTNNNINDESLKNMRETLKNNKPKSTDICTIIFTSGTSGNPKGAMITHYNFVAFSHSYLLDGNRLGIIKYEVTLSYLPLAHIYERLIESALPFFGAKIGYFSGNIKDISSDINALKPTFLITVPRILQKIHDNIMGTLKNKNIISQLLVKLALKCKRKNYAKNPKKFSHKFWDLILKPIRNRLGGRLRIQVMGSSSMDKNKLVDIQMLLSTPISEGWGMTEVGVGFVQHRNDNIKGTIGGMFSNIILKVIKVPNMKYDPKEYPNRGELCVKGDSVMVGYFRDEELTKKSFDQDGFFLTGDIVEVNENNRYIKIIDRAKNIFKLAQGEYIEPEKLENIYSNSIYIEHIFVHGYSQENELVSIIVPSEIFVKEYAKKHNIDLPYEELLKNETIKKLISDEILSASKTYKLNGIEKIRLFHLTHIPFSVENKQLTPTHKIVRNVILEYYKTVIDELYASRTT